MGNAMGVEGGSGGGGGGFGGFAGETAHTHRDPDPADFIRNGTPVYVNVYHLMAGAPPQLNGAVMGMGVFHSGVECGGTEWAFGGNQAQPETPGIFTHPPKAILPSAQFHRSHHVGNVPRTVTTADLQNVVRHMLTPAGGHWKAGSYSLLARNCNHFAEEFMAEISRRFVEPAGAPPLVFPSYVNRAAKLGSSFVPPQLAAMFQQAAPPAPGDGTAPQPQQQQSRAAPAPPRASQPPRSQPRASEPAEQGRHVPGSRPYATEVEEPTASPSPAPPAPSRPPAAKPAAATPQASPPPAAAATFTALELRSMTARQLRVAAEKAGVATDGLLEKNDYITAILDHQRRN